ncbi:MAG: hypothetical protein ACREPH_02200 [Rhodanobacteraceae bacterium]
MMGIEIFTQGISNIDDASRTDGCVGACVVGRAERLHCVHVSEQHAVSGQAESIALTCPLGKPWPVRIRALVTGIGSVKALLPRLKMARIASS